MNAPRMHEGELSIDADLVARLIAAQFPQSTDAALREYIDRRTGELDA